MLRPSSKQSARPQAAQQGSIQTQSSRDRLAHEEELASGGEEVEGEEDAEDEGGARPHRWIPVVMLTGVLTGPSSSVGAARVTSVPSGIASSVAAPRLPRQTDNIP